MDYPVEKLINHLIEQNNIITNNKDKTIIRNGEKINTIHNDIHKFLYIGENNNENKIYCVKNSIELTIIHKSGNTNRDYFIENDDIILIGRNNNQYNFKTMNVYDSNDQIIYEKSLFKFANIG